ncbi:MAG: carbon-nitrogen family hydrolase [Lachnospiraceae bacterium]|nr:carbon-nitrogen family hydrolase [Lachnospiraceae bacterium]
MRVALGQMDMVREDKKASLVKAEKMAEEAAAAKADIIIFPEMSLTGFSMALDKIGEDEKSPESVNAMAELAIQNNIAIGFGWAALPVPGSIKGTNRFTVIGSDGNIITEYKKINPFTYGGESEVYESGNNIVTAQFAGHTISLFICYDLRFPELFQIASEKADVLFVIADWPAIRSTHWTTLIRARAIETQSYVVGVNCYGVHNSESSSGGSLVVDSIGNILGQISGREGVLICDIDNRAWSLRDKFNTRKDRKTEFYINEYLRLTGKENINL